MSKHISPSYFYKLPSGAKVHPCRLILKDGSLMWKHALLNQNNAALPECEAHEQHIIKTAQRLEELNSWVSQDLRTVELFSSYISGMHLACRVMNKVSLLTSLTRLKIQLKYMTSSVTTSSLTRHLTYATSIFTSSAADQAAYQRLYQFSESTRRLRYH